MKRKQMEAAAYDEASSGSDDNGDYDDSSSDGESSASSPPVNRTASSDDDESDSDDSSESSDEESEEDRMKEDKHMDHDGSSHSSASEDDDLGNDQADIPLAERLQRKEARGVPLKEKRERKKAALEFSREKLRKLQKSKKSKSGDEEEDHGPPTKRKKKSKHAPTEVSSKRSDFYRRGPMRLNESGVGVEIGANRYKPLDPRTSNLSGHLNEEQFENNYSFLQDMRDEEIANLKKRISAHKQSGKKGNKMRKKLGVAAGALEEDELRLKKLKQEKADFERRKVERAAKQAVKKKIQSQVEEGKGGAYFLKRKEKKRLEFEAKMEELKKRGGHKAVEKALAKRRQKAKSRDAGLFAK